MTPLGFTLWFASWIWLYGLVTFLHGHTVPRGHPVGTDQAQLCRGPSTEPEHSCAADLYLPPKNPTFTQKHPGHREAPASLTTGSDPTLLPAFRASQDRDHHRLSHSSITWLPKAQINIFLQVLEGEGGK